MDPTATVAMPQFLEQVGREFTDLSAEIERLQDTISELLAGAAVEPRLLEQAQALDHVFQHAAELGAILARAAEQTPERWRLPLQPILSAVSLSGLARRLAGRAAEAAASGELEIF
ncbi:MAG TPA: hypothetical protein VHW60_20955 [Caulobacteraceae bacterium]|nr:hypothetical protein [Caulobacteraceae bacterium]